MVFDDKRRPGRPRKGSPRTWAIPDYTIAGIEEAAHKNDIAVPELVRILLAECVDDPAWIAKVITEWKEREA